MGELIKINELTLEQISKWVEEIRKYNDEHSKIENLSKADNNVKIEIKKRAINIYQTARKKEPLITVMLMYLLPSDFYFCDLKERIKSMNSLENKIYKKYCNNEKLEIKDSIRYTLIVSYDNYVDKVDDFLHKMEKYGYDVVYFKNRWNDAFCKGISVIFKDESETLFEIQFHTKENYDVKEIFSREPYELTKDKNAPPLLYLKADILRRYYHLGVKVPLGACDYEFKSSKKIKK